VVVAPSSVLGFSFKSNISPSLAALHLAALCQR
jgi:hypothetical protein